MRAPAIGERWEARRLLALLTATCVAAAMFLVYAGTAMADDAPPDDVVPQDAPAGTNEGPYWVNYLETVRGISGATCTKIDESGASAFVMPAAPAGTEWVLLVVKQATDNFVYYDPVAGHSYPSTGGQAPGYSHLIVCSVPMTTTTTQATTTTTEATTTTTEATTTTTEATTTTTIEDEVLPTVVTTVPDEVDDEELPFTGVDSDVMLGLAVALLGGGALLLLMTRRLEEN